MITEEEINETGDNMKEIISELEKANIVGKKHAPRLMIGINILSVIWRCVTFWRGRGDK